MRLWHGLIAIKCTGNDIAWSSALTQLHHFTRGTGDIDALVLVLFVHGKLADAERLTSLWAHAVPRCAFAGIELDLGATAMDPARLREIIMDEAFALGLQSWQIVLVGVAVAARHALELATIGVVPGISAIVVDLPPGPLPATPPGAAASIRFVQHRRADDPDGASFDALVHALRMSSLDTRIVVLPAGADPSSQAFGTFLVELVANSSRNRPGGGR
jgi:hypothetical protein